MGILPKRTCGWICRNDRTCIEEVASRSIPKVTAAMAAGAVAVGGDPKVLTRARIHDDWIQFEVLCICAMSVAC